MRARRELIGNDGMLMCFADGTPLGMMYRVFSGVDGGELGSVQPFDPAFRGAVFVGPAH